MARLRWCHCNDVSIGFSNELPDFPAQLSALGHDFLDKCLRREPNERWTCGQLLQHPFVSMGAITEPSPRCVLDWPNSEFYDNEEEEEEIQVHNGSILLFASLEYLNSFVCLPSVEWLNCVINCSSSGGGSGG
uniref:Uncharacterized protein n=1 Tax=Nelumbo nucifera TaxID=4432 RepID=A0A822ZSY1_NELNU|nr:TPA_asm: hypothetical protein HUJ06_017557 [Nelumbo nucifera]